MRELLIASRVIPVSCVKYLVEISNFGRKVGRHISMSWGGKGIMDVGVQAPFKCISNLWSVDAKNLANIDSLREG
jgi:hypothetical protein